MMRCRKRTALVVAGLLWSAAGIAELPDSVPRPGGIAVLPVGDSAARPTVHFDDRPALVMQNGERWYAVVGIPLRSPDGPASIAVVGADGARRTIEFEIVPYGYREQRLTVEKSYVEPDQAQLERIMGERRIIDAALNSYRDADVDSLTLPAPVAGRRSPSFGFRRFFNDQPRAPHSGMDIAADRGSTVFAPRAGVVAATGDYYFNGKTVIVDHGQGFVTMYCHLDRIDVDTDQSIEAGHALGIVGATGRVTGAHLHFGTYLTGTAIDPALLLEPE